MGCASSRPQHPPRPIPPRASVLPRARGYQISNPRPFDPGNPYPQTPVRYKNDLRLLENQNVGRLRREVPHREEPRRQEPRRQEPHRQEAAIELDQILRRPEPARQKEGRERERPDSVYAPVPAETPYFKNRGSWYPPVPATDGMFTTKRSAPVQSYSARAESSRRSERDDSSNSKGKGKGRRKEAPLPLPLRSQLEHLSDRES